MKVIAINGSPRRNWNTAQLCQAALEGKLVEVMEFQLSYFKS